MLFLKMAQKRATRKAELAADRPGRLLMAAVADAEATELKVVYTQILVGLAQEPGTLGTIFRKAQKTASRPCRAQAAQLPASELPWTRRLWVQDLRTQPALHAETDPLRRHHLDEFVASYLPGRRATNASSRSGGPFSHDDLLARDTVARGIVEDLTTALAEFDARRGGLETDTRGSLRG